ncbi:MAG: hypothetical protein GDA48_02330 [Hormoscilla sp. GM102CHS1]|nr:hypothetical protein [Hormoscilla sp. GM102CHS1]
MFYLFPEQSVWNCRVRHGICVMASDETAIAYPRKYMRSYELSREQYIFYPIPD